MLIGPTSIQQHAMSLQPHARLMHHTTHSATDTRRIVGTMASSLPFQAQRRERDVQLSCRGGRGRGFQSSGWYKGYSNETASHKAG
jgi:hypothetical protein